MAATNEEYAPDGPVARKIAAVIPYYPYKGIPRFYDINGFLVRPDIFQLVVDVFVQRYAKMEIDSIGGFDARGFVIGAPIALALKKPFFMLRKPGKQPNAVTSGAYEVEYGTRQGVSIPRGHPLSKDDPLKMSTVVKKGDRVLLVDDLCATGGTLAAGIELVHRMGARVVENACVVELKMFADPPAESGLPSRKKLFASKGIADVPIWALISEEILTLAGELPSGYVDDGEEH
jgi:adenine phosphoribosyltransferase